MEEFLDVKTAFRLAKKRAAGLDEDDFLERLVALASARKVRAIGHRLASGEYAQPLERAEIPATEWTGGSLINIYPPGGVLWDGPLGWTLAANSINLWANIEVRAEDILAEWTGETQAGSPDGKQVRRPGKYHTAPRGRAECMLKSVFPAGIPERDALLNSKLCEKVQDSDVFKALPPRDRPSDDTILRAAGRLPDRRKKANSAE